MQSLTSLYSVDLYFMSYNSDLSDCIRSDFSMQGGCDAFLIIVTDSIVFPWVFKRLWIRFDVNSIVFISSIDWRSRTMPLKIWRISVLLTGDFVCVFWMRVLILRKFIQFYIIALLNWEVFMKYDQWGISRANLLGKTPNDAIETKQLICVLVTNKI